MQTKESRVPMISSDISGLWRKVSNGRVLDSFRVTNHELLVEVGAQHIVDKLFLLAPLLGATRLVLEHYIVVPAAFHGEVARVE